MKQSDGTDLFGANNPRRSDIGVIYVSPNDDRQSVLTAILTQDKLGRKQVAVVLPRQNRSFQRSVDFDGLKNMRRGLQVQLVFVAPGGSNSAEYARQRRFPVYSSLEEYAQTLHEEYQDQDATGIADDNEIEFPVVEPTPVSQDDEINQPGNAPPQVSAGSEPDSSSPTGVEDDSEPDIIRIPASPTIGAPVPDNLPVPVGVSVPVASANVPPAPFRGGYPPATAPRRSRMPWLIATLILVLLVLIGYFIYRPVMDLIFVPSATVMITPASKELKNAYAITAVIGTPDPAKRQVQARLLYAASAEQSKTVKASGVGRIAATVAAGSLTFYNSSSADQTVPAGTVFTDSNGVQIVNDVDAAIPAGNQPTAAQITVPAHAVNTGENGNIPAFDFNNVPCCAPGVYVLNTTAFSGGQNAQIFTYVEQTDIDKATSALEASVKPNVQTALQKQIHTNEQLVSPSQCVTNVNADHSAGEQASNVSVNVTEVCTGEVYDQQAAQLMAQEMLKTDPNEYPGNGFVPVGNIATVIAKATADAKGVVSLLVNAEGVWVYQFNNAQKQELVKLIAGKSQKEAQSLLLQQAGVDMTAIQLFWGDGNTLPKDHGQITLAVLSVPGLQGLQPR
jgi:hypothetical protein